MKYKTRSYPLFSACGLNCGLCPRHHSSGTSRCPGCAGEWFSSVHPSCGILSCCNLKDIEYCFLCNEYPCKKYNGADLNDSFISHKNQVLDLERAKQIGMNGYETELSQKVKVLKYLLSNHDDGRRKSFFCTAVNLMTLNDLNTGMELINSEVKKDDSVKTKALIAVRIFENMAEIKGISLKLRKGNKA